MCSDDRPSRRRPARLRARAPGSKPSAPVAVAEARQRLQLPRTVVRSGRARLGPPRPPPATDDHTVLLAPWSVSRRSRYLLGEMGRRLVARRRAGRRRRLVHATTPTPLRVCRARPPGPTRAPLVEHAAGARRSTLTSRRRTQCGTMPALPLPGRPAYGGCDCALLSRGFRRVRLDPDLVHGCRRLPPAREPDGAGRALAWRGPRTRRRERSSSPRRLPLLGLRCRGRPRPS